MGFFSKQTRVTAQWKHAAKDTIDFVHYEKIDGIAQSNNGAGAYKDKTTSTTYKFNEKPDAEKFVSQANAYQQRSNVSLCTFSIR